MSAPLPSRTAKDWLMAMRWFESLNPELPRLGQSKYPKDDAVAVRANPSLSFSAQQFEMLNENTLALQGFGLMGCNGALPLHLTELALEAQRNHHPQMLEFINLFHHRMSLLWFASWINTRLEQSVRANDDNTLLAQMGKLSGQFLGVFSAGWQNRRQLQYQCLPDLARQGRHVEGVKRALQITTRLPIEVRDFVGRWVDIPKPYRTQLRSTVSHTTKPSGVFEIAQPLGAGLPIGSKTFECQTLISICVGPLSFEEYVRLLPGQPQRKVMDEVIRFYLGFDFDVTLRAKLICSTVKPLALTSRDKPGGYQGRLGLTAWLPLASASKEFEYVQLN